MKDIKTNITTEPLSEVALSPEFVCSLLKELLGEDLSESRKKQIKIKLASISHLTKKLSNEILFE